MDYLVEQYRQWMTDNISLTNAFSEESMRRMSIQMMLGNNYRLITEKNTKSKLTLTYLWLTDVINNAKNEFGADWKDSLVEDLQSIRHRTPEQNNLLFWLAGLTKKTSTNVGVSKRDLALVIEELQTYIGDLLTNIDRYEDMDKAWLLMMAGSATLHIRGSDKSKVGKALEGVLIRSILTILGLKENENFWMNIARDAEVDRETDCEIQTARGRIRVEVGLISAGNQEVIEDKINRVGANGVVLFDKVGQKTSIYETADRHRVKLIQIRNNQPLVEMYRHLRNLVNIDLNEPPELESDIINSVNSLPAEIFRVQASV